MFEQLSDSPSIPAIPLLIHELRRGDRTGAVRRLVGDGLMSPWHPLGHLVACNDYGAEYSAAVAAAVSEIAATYRIMADDLREHCDVWLPGARRVPRQPLVTDIPTLILNGEFDPHGSTFHTQVLRTGLKRAYVYELRGRGHGSLPAGCASSVVERFVADPTRAPDGSCLAAEEQVAFATRQFAVTTLTFLITTDSKSPFAGEWQAEIPAGPSVTFTLKIEKSLLTGAIKRQAPPDTQVLDGKADQNAIAFTVRSPDGRRTIRFVGTLNGNQIVFSREVEQIGPAGQPRPGVFGDEGLRTFIARRR